MTDYTQDENDGEQFDGDNEQQEENSRKGWRKRLETKAARADSLERENAFLKAGIDVDNARFKYFVRGYDGEISRDAITQAASEAGLLDGKGAVTPEELARHGRVAGASAGAGAAGEADKNDMNSIIRRAAGVN